MLVWRSCGQRTEQDLTVVCLRARVVRRPAKLGVVNSALTEAFADQVNIVQVALGGGMRSLLFTRDSRSEQWAP